MVVVVLASLLGLSLLGCSGKDSFSSSGSPESYNEMPDSAPSEDGQGAGGEVTQSGDSRAQGSDARGPSGDAREGEDGSLDASMVSAVRAACSEAGVEPKSMTVSLSFPPTRNCAFGQDGNGREKDAHYQASVKVDRSFKTPENAAICSFKLVSRTKSIRYDDVVVITLNEYILATSNSSIYPDGIPQTALSKWSFEAIKGKELVFEAPQSCLGEPSSICEMPGHDRAGGFDLDLNNEVLAPLSAVMLGGEEKTLSVITLGDNDPEDCEHTGVDFDVTYTFVELP